MKSKKVISLLLAGLLTAGMMSGCGGQAGNDASGGADSKEDTPAGGLAGRPGLPIVHGEHLILHEQIGPGPCPEDSRSQLHEPRLLAMYFTKDALLLGYCAGSEADGSCLVRTRVRRVERRGRPAGPCCPHRWSRSSTPYR